MIELTRLNGQKVWVNCDQMQCAEASPDTTLTLITGDKLLVRESCAEVAASVMAYHAGVMRHAGPAQAAAQTNGAARGRVRGEYGYC